MMAATWWLPPGFEQYEYVCVYGARRIVPQGKA